MKSPKNIVKALTLTALIVSTASVDAAMAPLASLGRFAALRAGATQGAQTLWNGAKTAASSGYGKLAGVGAATVGAYFGGGSFFRDYFTPEVPVELTKFQKATEAVKSGWNKASSFVSDKCSKAVEQVKAHPYIAGGAALATGAVLGTAAYFGYRMNQAAKAAKAVEAAKDMEEADAIFFFNSVKTEGKTVKECDALLAEIAALESDEIMKTVSPLYKDALTGLTQKINARRIYAVKEEATAAAIAAAKAAKPVASAKVAVKPVVTTVTVAKPVTTVTVAKPTDKQIAAALNRIQKSMALRKEFFAGNTLCGVTAEDVKADHRFAVLKSTVNNNMTRTCATRNCAKAA